MTAGAVEHYLAQHRKIAGALPGRGLGWLQERRRAGLARLKEVGFPTKRDEDWKYPSTHPLTAKPFRDVGAPAAADKALAKKIRALAPEGLRSRQLVFIDGLFAPQLSDAGADTKGGATLIPLARVLEERPESVAHAFGALAPRKPHGFTALNCAGARDGAVVLLEKDAAPEEPLELLFVTSAEDAFAQPRNLILAAPGCKASVIERHVSLGEHASFTNSASEILLGESANVDYHLVQTQRDSARHVCGIWARQERGSRLRCISATLGGAFVRNDLGVELAGEDAHCDMLGFYAATGAQHVDNHTAVLHNAPHCGSREVYKGVLDGRARAVFHGRITVAPGAQKTAAEQSNQNLLLSRHAEIDCKPQLEIYADDVRCSHGATAGQLDEAALFYLRSRGIGEARARELLTFAFVNEVAGEIQIAALKGALESLLARRLAR